MGKGNKFGKMILASLAAQILLAVPVQAGTLDQLEEQELEKQAEISNLEWTIANKLASINEKKAEVEDLQNQINEIEVEKENTIVAIEETKAQIAARKKQLEERLVALQTSSTSTNRILMIFESENIGDFLGRIMLVGQLQAADNERIEAAIAEEEQLAELETKLETEIQAVEEKTAEKDTESAVMYEELGELQAILNENQDALQSILTAQTEEEARLAEVARAEKEAAEKAAAAKAEAERLAAEQAAAEQAEAERLAAEQAAAEKRAEEARLAAERAEAERKAAEEAAELAKAEQPAPAPVVEQVNQPAPAKKGRTLTVTATAYSRHEAGLTNHTFTGIDLRQNPMVIAVDPNVIPLGSLLDVPGYGVAIAGDTGGAIKGNRIDLHMEDVARMNAFGVQTMTITILE